VKDRAINKDAVACAIAQMFGFDKKNLKNIPLLEKFSIQPQTITLKADGSKTEDMKLGCVIDFDEMGDYSIPYEDTSFYAFFHESHFFFPVFQEPYDGCPLSENFFRGFKRVELPEEIVDKEAKRVFQRIRDLVVTNTLAIRPVISKKTGKPIINPIGTIKEETNLPKAKDGMLFLKGTGGDSTKKTEKVNGLSLYRQNVWFRGNDIINILNQNAYL